MLSAIELMQLEDLAAELAKKQQPQNEEEFNDWYKERSEELYDTNFGI